MSLPKDFPVRLLMIEKEVEDVNKELRLVVELLRSIDRKLATKEM